MDDTIKSLAEAKQLLVEINTQKIPRYRTRKKKRWGFRGNVSNFKVIRL